MSPSQGCPEQVAASGQAAHSALRSASCLAATTVNVTASSQPAASAGRVPAPGSHRPP